MHKIINLLSNAEVAVFSYLICRCIMAFVPVNLFTGDKEPLTGLLEPSHKHLLVETLKGVLTGVS